MHWIAAGLLATSLVTAQDLDSLPILDVPPSERAEQDWLLDASSYVARLGRSTDSKELVLDNGLVRRAWRLAPNAACVAFDDLMRGESLLRAVRPEAVVTIDGTEHPIGGLVGQPNHAYLTAAWLDAMRPDPTAMRFVGWSSGPIEPRLEWKRVRHAAPDAIWPPKGVHLTLDFAPAPRLPEQRLELLLRDDFSNLEHWTTHVSTSHPRSSIENEGKPGEIYTPANTACYVERALPPGVRAVEATIDTGTDNSASWGPGIALVFANRTIKLNLRPGGNESDSAAMLGLWDGASENPGLGGRQKLDLSKPWNLRLRITDSAIHCEARPAGGSWHEHGKLDLDAPLGDPRAVRIGKLDRAGDASDFGTPGELVRARIIDFGAFGAAPPLAAEAAKPSFRIAVHYELYDGIPLLSKWLVVHNDSGAPLVVDRFQSEVLAIVEHANHVETRDGVLLPTPQHLHVETDFAFGGFSFENANRHVVHWRTDPQFTTQVNYLRQTPCLLVTEPTYGPEQSVAPGGTFTSFRTFELAYDSLDRERQGLALRRMYRTIAPWVTENPLMMHMRDSDPARVRAAIDQCVDVGFEMLILSFGSGFDMENDKPEYLAQWHEVAGYAKSRGIEIGGYSLLASRRIGGGNDVVSPAGERPTFGSCPALTSEWGRRYYEKLYAFFPATGFTLLEHDGPYPGDVDVTPRPPFQKGESDSRWVQWRIAAGFYEWCRAQGIYVNAPDHYFLNGTNKCGMGYREVNWSLPRAQQVIHTRQNIHDGTWRQPPAMGWMFVPLTQYHGGGPAATIEPLDEHLDHYDRMITSNLALGVQACYRGPRLYDTQRTRDLVAGRVAWFKRHRDILESDLVHGRRADGRDVDWMLHVNPRLEERGMLVVFNPLDEAVTRTLDVDPYFTGLTGALAIAVEDGPRRIVQPGSRGRVRIEVTVPAAGFTWVVMRAP